jgi:hypothetical protein
MELAPGAFLGTRQDHSMFAVATLFGAAYAPSPSTIIIVIISRD